MDKNIQYSVHQFESDLATLFSKRVVEIIIYGSSTRGDFNADTSDIDFIVFIEGKLSYEDINSISELHLRYRSRTSIERLLEGRYIGIVDQKFENGYYVGTKTSGWKEMKEFGLSELEMAMVLDSYESLGNHSIIHDFLHYEWANVEQEIIAQIDEFRVHPLLGNDIHFTHYAVVAAARSLFTFIHHGFLTKTQAMQWVVKTYPSMDLKNPKLFLEDIQREIIRQTKM